jgi:hypothetical protein
VGGTRAGKSDYTAHTAQSIGGLALSLAIGASVRGRALAGRLRRGLFVIGAVVSQDAVGIGASVIRRSPVENHPGGAFAEFVVAAGDPSAYADAAHLASAAGSASARRRSGAAARGEQQPFLRLLPSGSGPVLLAGGSDVADRGLGEWFPGAVQESRASSRPAARGDSPVRNTLPMSSRTSRISQPITIRRAVARDAKRLTRLVRGSGAYEGKYAAAVAGYRVGPESQVFCAGS